MLEPTTLYLGEKANKLLKELAAENEMASRFFFTKIIIREARNSVAGLRGDKLKERLQLIDEANDELVNIINNAPFYLESVTDENTNPRKIYARIWDTHKRLEKKGLSKLEIHDYCLARYGIDFDIKKTPTKNPKSNPDWVGGGTKAKEIKQARETSRKIEIEDGR